MTWNWETFTNALAEELVANILVALVSLLVGGGVVRHYLRRAAKESDEKVEAAEAKRTEALRESGRAAQELEQERQAHETTRLARNDLSEELDTARTQLRRVESAISDGGALLRKLQEPSPFAARASRIPTIAFGNLKGGVGKTTLAANFGAWVGDQERQGFRKPVLFVDLDFQGSLSSICFSAGQTPPPVGMPEPTVREIFMRDPDDAFAHAHTVVHPRLTRSRYFSADFDVSDTEEKLLLEWTLRGPEIEDPRLRIAKLLASDAVQESFSAVVIDLPPRASLFAVAGLVAATSVVVTTRQDRLSLDAVPRFAGYLARGRDEGLWPNLKLAGLAAPQVPSNRFEPVRHELRQSAADMSALWTRTDTAVEADLLFLGHLPYMRAVADAAAENFAYFNDRAADAALAKTPQQHFSEIGEKIWRRAQLT